MTEVRSTGSRYCRCGATATVSSASPRTVVDIVAMWDELHAGEGHGPVSRQQAGRARRRAERETRQEETRG